MHNHDLSRWQHDHIFDSGKQRAERSARIVMWITLVMMVLEIAGGWWFNSMALLADGWHMSSHALALGLSAFAYAAARRYARDPRFAFGSWKIEVLAGYTSAILLVCVAALMVVGSVERLLSPMAIHYQEAVLIAILGLAVNLVCARILGNAHGHGHDGHTHDSHHAHEHEHEHELHSRTDSPHQDLNLKSAYVHVLADALTSILAIIALLGGWLYGWAWLDPVMGIAGALLVGIWAWGLIADTSKILLDREMDHHLVDEIREVFASGLSGQQAMLADLHVWRVGQRAYAATLVVITHDADLTPEHIKAHLHRHKEIVHLTVEVNQCT